MGQRNRKNNKKGTSLSKTSGTNGKLQQSADDRTLTDNFTPKKAVKVECKEPRNIPRRGIAALELDDSPLFNALPTHGGTSFVTPKRSFENLSEISNLSGYYTPSNIFPPAYDETPPLPADYNKSESHSLQDMDSPVQSPLSRSAKHRLRVQRRKNRAKQQDEQALREVASMTSLIASDSSTSFLSERNETDRQTLRDALTALGDQTITGSQRAAYLMRVNRALELQPTFLRRWSLRYDMLGPSTGLLRGLRLAMTSQDDDILAEFTRFIENEERDNLEGTVGEPRSIVDLLWKVVDSHRSVETRTALCDLLEILLHHSDLTAADGCRVVTAVKTVLHAERKDIGLQTDLNFEANQSTSLHQGFDVGLQTDDISVDLITMSNCSERSDSHIVGCTPPPTDPHQMTKLDLEDTGDKERSREDSLQRAPPVIRLFDENSKELTQHMMPPEPRSSKITLGSCSETGEEQETYGKMPKNNNRKYSASGTRISVVSSPSRSREAEPIPSTSTNGPSNDVEAPQEPHHSVSKNNKTVSHHATTQSNGVLSVRCSSSAPPAPPIPPTGIPGLTPKTNPLFANPVSDDYVSVRRSAAAPPAPPLPPSGIPGLAPPKINHSSMNPGPSHGGSASLMINKSSPPPAPPLPLDGIPGLAVRAGLSIPPAPPLPDNLVRGPAASGTPPPPGDIPGIGLKTGQSIPPAPPLPGNTMPWKDTNAVPRAPPMPPGGVPGLEIKVGIPPAPPPPPPGLGGPRSVPQPPPPPPPLAQGFDRPDGLNMSQTLAPGFYTKPSPVVPLYPKKKKTKTVQWVVTAVPDAQEKSTVFGQKEDEKMSADETEGLERLFESVSRVTPLPSPNVTLRRASIAPGTLGRLSMSGPLGPPDLNAGATGCPQLDYQRAMKISIVIKKMPLNEMIQSLMECKESEAVTIENLQALIDVYPTEEEMSMFRDLPEELLCVSGGKPDKTSHFVWQAAKKPTLLLRAELELDKQNISHALVSHSQVAEELLANCDLLKQKSVRSVMRKALDYGNFLNQGSFHKAHANGFALSSLPDVLQTKGTGEYGTERLVDLLVKNMKFDVDEINGLLKNLEILRTNKIADLSESVKNLERKVEGLYNKVSCTKHSDLKQRYKVFVKVLLEHRNRDLSCLKKRRHATVFCSWKSRSETADLKSRVDTLKEKEKALGTWFCVPLSVDAMADHVVTAMKFVVDAVKQQTAKEEKARERAARAAAMSRPSLTGRETVNLRANNGRGNLNRDLRALSMIDLLNGKYQ